MSDARVHAVVPSPLGELLLIGEQERLCGLYMNIDMTIDMNVAIRLASGRRPRAALGRRDDRALPGVRLQLEEYFAGTRTAFDLPLRLDGTAFQREVWQALCEIPFGQTRSYGEQARRIGKPEAVRAVGAANGQNPISIIVPCHRVIGANGALTGYGGGIQNKRWLLMHENRGENRGQIPIKF